MSTTAMPRVSFVIPAYNAEPYLRPALQSVRDQTYADFEAVVIDDGSTDGTNAIIREFVDADSRFRLLAKPNTGLIDSLNRGLAEARGELIARFDADDICRPERLAVQMAYLDANPNCIAVGSGITVIDEEGRTLREIQPAAMRVAPPIDGNFPPTSLLLTHPTVTFRKSAVVRSGGYSAAYEAAEDYELWLRIRALGDIVELPQALIYYRQHGASVSSRKLQLQRLSCLKADVAIFLRRRPGTEDLIAQAERAETVAEVARIGADPRSGLPSPSLIELYYQSGLLRRVLYRGAPGEVRSTATAIASGAVGSLGQAATNADARRIVGKAVVELLRVAAVTATGRNKKALAAS